MDSSIEVTVKHYLWLGVVTERISEDLKQGTVVVVRQNGSQMLVYGKGFVREVQPERQHVVLEPGVKSHGLPLQLMELAIYLWLLYNGTDSTDHIARHTNHLLGQIIEENSDYTNQGIGRRVRL